MAGQASQAPVEYSACRSQTVALPGTAAAQVSTKARYPTTIGRFQASDRVGPVAGLSLIQSARTV